MQPEKCVKPPKIREFLPPKRDFARFFAVLDQATLSDALKNGVCHDRSPSAADVVSPWVEWPSLRYGVMGQNR
jgi:hypothetical protein